MINFTKGVDVANIYKDEKFVTSLKILQTFDTHVDRIKHSRKDPRLSITDNIFMCPDDFKMRLSPSHDKDQNMRIVVIGPSGSGKSTWVKNYILDYKKKYPRRDCFLFSKHEADPSIDSAKPFRVKITEAEVAASLTSKTALFDITSLSNSLVVFDDTYSASSKLLVNFWDRLATDLAQNGRKLGIDLIFVLHNTDHSRTRFLMSESTHYVLFLRSGATAMYERILGSYLGIKDPKITDKLFELPTRYCVFSNISPIYILTEDMCFDYKFLKTLSNR